MRKPEIPENDKVIETNTQIKLRDIKTDGEIKIARETELPP